MHAWILTLDVDNNEVPVTLGIYSTQANADKAIKEFQKEYLNTDRSQFSYKSYVIDVIEV